MPQQPPAKSVLSDNHSNTILVMCKNMTLAVSYLPRFCPFGPANWLRSVQLAALTFTTHVCRITT